MTYRSPAIKRYSWRIAAFMLLFVALIFTVGFWFREAPPEGALAWAVAILPALPIIGVIWTIFRLLAEESDEYIRMMLVRQVLFATGFCLCVMTVWEFLQNYEVVAPGNGGFGTAFFWFIGLGFGAAWNGFFMAREAREG